MIRKSIPKGRGAEAVCWEEDGAWHWKIVLGDGRVVARSDAPLPDEMAAFLELCELKQLARLMPCF